MRRRLLGTLLWCVLLPVAGLVRLLWVSLRLAVARVERVFVLCGLAVVLSMRNFLTAQLSADLISPQGQQIVSSVLAVLGVTVLIYGVQSRWLRRLRKALQGRG